MRKRIFRETLFFLINYIFGPLMGVSICLLEACGRIKFRNFQRFPIWDGKLIMVSNHPSLLEPWILPMIGFPWMNFPWIFSPVWTRLKFSFKSFHELRKEFTLQKRLIPANVPDKNNFYDPLLIRWLNSLNVPADRNGNMQSRIGTVNALVSILENRGRVLIFPEGTRTFKSREQHRLKSAYGKELGKLKDGAGWLALKTNARILPIWVEGTDNVLPNNKFPFPRLWHKVTINIGSPFHVTGQTREEATREITTALLELADEHRNGHKKAVLPE